MSIDVSLLGLGTAFAAGVVSFVSPCVLPLVPGYLSYISGQSIEDVLRDDGSASRVGLMGQSLLFVLGFSTVFVALGASASAIGRLLLAWRYEAEIVGGTLIVVMGAALAGLLPSGWLQGEWRWHGAAPTGRALTAYGLGVAFAFGWTPCIGPVLGAILTLGANTASVADGSLLLSAYALGLGIPFLLTAAFAVALIPRLRHARRLGARLQRLSGWLLMLLGIAMATGYLTVFSNWLLLSFPGLGTLG